MIDLVPLGDRAWLARFATEAEAGAWARAVRGAAIAGVAEVASAYRSAAVFAEPDLADLETIEQRLRTLAQGAPSDRVGSLVRVPVLYDGADLAAVARRVGLSEAEVVRAHSGRDYDVFAVGFLPGFPYAGYLADEISGLRRRDTPRPRVPEGSVAIAGRQTGIYPAPSPGGWHLIGRTPLRIVDLAAGHFPIRAGDRLRFVPIDAGEFGRQAGQLLRPVDPGRGGDPSLG